MFYSAGVRKYRELSRSEISAEPRQNIALLPERQDSFRQPGFYKHSVPTALRKANHAQRSEVRLNHARIVPLDESRNGHSRAGANAIWL